MIIPQDIFDHLPLLAEARWDEKKEVGELLKPKLNKLLQQLMSDTAGKVIMLKKSCNIQKSDRNDLDWLVSKLKRIDGELHALMDT